MKILFLFITLMATVCNMTAESLSPQQFADIIAADPDAVIIDVRQPDEFGAGHIPGARNIDWLDTDNFKTEVASLQKDKHYYIYCRSGKRSDAAMNYLTSEGFYTKDLQGGIMAWQEAGFPVSK